MIAGFVYPLAALLGWFLVSYFLSRLLKRNDVADPMWGTGFVALAWASSVSIEHFDLRTPVVLWLVTFWGVRLSVYLWVRLWAKPEDIRYQEMRKNWGASEPLRALTTVFLLQGVLMGVITLPMIFTLLQSGKGASVPALGGWDFFGFSFAILGLLFEVISDGEMMRFKARSKKGEILTTGLWRWSRHPNYFGEILFWWGIFFLSLAGPLGWWGIVSPILITFLLLKVSGVPMMDRLMAQKGQAFRDYSQRTRALLPFGLQHLGVFFGIMAAMLILDIFWLGFLMQDFYVEQARALVRLDERGGYDPLMWAVVGVYLCIPLGIQFFAVTPSRLAGEVLFRGGFFGFVSYGIYEFTNLSLLKDWPAEMALVDLGWGVVLCSVSAYAGHWVREILQGRFHGK